MPAMTIAYVLKLRTVKNPSARPTERAQNERFRLACPLHLAELLR